mmetsp:Transcript_14509/g.22683  ORF Transcript_14509/g.22683 Transcript_14509/m.22683 type:complete len:234 (+) Transcript_14509:96-797(+)
MYVFLSDLFELFAFLLFLLLSFMHCQVQQAIISPLAPLFNLARLTHFALHLLMDLVPNLRRPMFKRISATLRLEHLAQHGMHTRIHIPSTVIIHSLRRIQMDRLKGSHKRPPQTQPILDRLIDILRIANTLCNALIARLQQRVLQSIHNKALRLFLHRARLQSNRLHDSLRALHHTLRSLARRTQLHHRNGHGRVHRMRHNHIRLQMRHLRDQFARHNRRRRRRDDRVALRAV